jgi:hypothetical protein
VETFPPATHFDRRNKSAGDRIIYLYGVPEGAPAICHANASGDEAVKSIAGSTVE